MASIVKLSTLSFHSFVIFDYINLSDCCCNFSASGFTLLPRYFFTLIIRSVILNDGHHLGLEQHRKAACLELNISFDGNQLVTEEFELRMRLIRICINDWQSCTIKKPHSNGSICLGTSVLKIVALTSNFLGI